MGKKEEIFKRFYDLDTELRSITDHDPRAAIERVRSLVPDEVLDQVNIDMLRAGVLIDAGGDAKDQAAVDEGVAILEKLYAKDPQSGMLAYNLANGLSIQSKFNTSAYADWFLHTSATRQRERCLFQQAGSANDVPHHLRAQAFTNLGNALLRASRFVEAYDSYTRAIKFDSTNGVALTGAVKLLRKFSRMDPESGQRSLALAGMYLRRAKADPDRIRELAGERGFMEISPLLKTDLPEIELPDFSKTTKYQQFVAKHRLALVPSIEGLDLNASRWDTLRFPGVTEKIEDCHGVPPLFGMFNIMKSDFIAARYLAYTALEEVVPETGKYSDTLDYARYGVKYSLLTLSQRSCMDLLDKVAVATSEYLSLPGDPNSIYFSNRWFDKRVPGSPPSWQPDVRAAIEKGNKALMAISEVSEDLGDSGFLHPKRTFRHSSTHRFTILHDLGETPSRVCRYIEHGSLAAFIDQLIETLQLTRAVLIYFVDLISYNEHLFHQDGVPRGQLIVPDHDWILGEEE